MFVFIFIILWVTNTPAIQADLIWRLGLRDAVEDSNRFSHIHYYSSNSAMAPASSSSLENKEEIQSILETSIAVNVFWCSSRKNATECKDMPKTKSSPSNIFGRFQTYQFLQSGEGLKVYFCKD